MRNWNLGAIGSTSSGIPTYADHLAARAVEEKKRPAINQAENSVAQAKIKFEQGLLSEGDYINICYQAWLLAKANTRS